MTGPLFFGLLAGVGVWIVLRAFAAPRRSLSRDLDALQQPNRDHEITVDMETRLARSAAGHFGDLLGADALRGDLELVGRTEEQHLVQRLRTALFYGGAPVVLWWLGVIAGVRVAPGAVAHAVGLAGLGAGWLVTDQQLRKRATETREQFGAALVTYLQLVAIQVAGGSGVDEALRTAADYSNDDAFALIRSCLNDARVRGVSPWEVMADRGERLGLDGLVDLASTMELAGLSGAHVRESLMTKARSLRLHQINESERDADTRTTAMAGPTSFMAGGFVVLIGYPAFTVILGL